MKVEPAIDGWQQAPHLQGEHVSLEPLRPEHTEGFQRASSAGQLWELWYTSVPRPEDVAAYVDAAVEAQGRGEALVFAVRSAAGEIVGTTRYYQLDRRVPRLAIGYTWYATHVQRTGLNTQAKLLLLEHAFETLGCESVAFETSWFNQKSRTAIARLGARQDGVLRNHLRHRDGTLRDTVVFSIIAGEWPAVKSNLLGKLQQYG
jgi:N-acetyltransferase